MILIRPSGRRSADTGAVLVGVEGVGHVFTEADEIAEGVR
jgi:hypothetical protein